MLDPKGKKEILDVIKRMKEDNPELTILSITHDVEEAWHADKIIVLNKGNIVLMGTPDEVFAQHETLNEIHLGVPFALQLKLALIERGIKIPDSIKTLDELEDYLCR